jgi:NAD+ diphosphatase
MTFPLFDAPQQEPSRFVGFGGNMIDRQAEHRSDDVTVRALAQPSARLMLMRGGRCYLKLAGETFQPYFSLAEAETLGAVLSDAVLAGSNPRSCPTASRRSTIARSTFRV